MFNISTGLKIILWHTFPNHTYARVVDEDGSASAMDVIHLFHVVGTCKTPPPIYPPYLCGGPLNRFSHSSRLSMSHGLGPIAAIAESKF